MWTGIKKQNKILNKTSCVTKTANFACVLAINLFRLSWFFFLSFYKTNSFLLVLEFSPQIISQ